MSDASDTDPVTAADLIGAWRLESWSLVYEDGRADEYPLGKKATGFILYTADGHMSATLARAGRMPLSSHDAAENEVREGAAFHSIEVATNPALAGITSTRHILLDGTRLTLSGPDFSPDAPRFHRIIWRRVKFSEA